jgi:hypothetical protein
MNRKRFVNLLLAVACVVMTGIILHQYSVPMVHSVPMVPAADTEGGSQQRLADGPNFADMIAAPAPIRKQVTAPIRAQLQAFAKGDYQAAMKYQSQNLRQFFPTVAQFRQMIITGYPEFAHYKSVKFEDVRADQKGEHAAVQVTLTGQDGVTINALYRMVREGIAYKVEGVMGGNPHMLPPASGPSIDA